MRLTELEAYNEIKALGFDITSNVNKGLLTVSANNNGVVFVRSGKYLEQCIKSLWFDIRNNY